MRFAKLPLGGPFVFAALLVLSVCTFIFPSLCVNSLEAATRARVDSKIIERIFGVRGQWNGEVFQVKFPRKRLGVRVSDVDFPAGMGLTSWLSFKGAGGNQVVVAKTKGPLVGEDREKSGGGNALARVPHFRPDDPPHSVQRDRPQPSDFRGRLSARCSG